MKVCVFNFHELKWEQKSQLRERNRKDMFTLKSLIIVAS